MSERAPVLLTAIWQVETDGQIFHIKLNLLINFFHFIQDLKAQEYNPSCKECILCTLECCAH